MRTSAGATGATIATAAVLLVGAVVAVVAGWRGAILRGLGIGAGLGVVNLAASLPAASHALRRGGNAVFGVVLGGFFARLVVLAGLTLWFQSVPAIDVTAFAVAFMVFFLLCLVLEVRLVQSRMKNAGGAT